MTLCWVLGLQSDFIRTGVTAVFALCLFGWREFGG